MEATGERAQGEMRPRERGEGRHWCGLHSLTVWRGYGGNIRWDEKSSNYTKQGTARGRETWEGAPTQAIREEENAGHHWDY